MKFYVLGFLFEGVQSQLPRVVLIRKNKPEFQKGRLNGVGGLIERGEHAYAAMQREFREEAGLDILGWRYVTQFSDGSTYRVFVFAATGRTDFVTTMTDEPIVIRQAADRNPGYMENLEWLIPLSLAVLREQYVPLDTDLMCDILSEENQKTI